jgi:RNA polymerase sigma factor (sigma-70 family)
VAVPSPNTEEHAAAVRVGERSTQPGPDDEYLVVLAKEGRSDAYDKLVRRYRRFVRVKSSSYFLLGGDADDLMQEGMLGLFKAIRDYRPERESSFRGFAELCITRQIITAIKTATRNKHTPLNQYVSFSQTPAAAGPDSRPPSRRFFPVNRPRSRLPGDRGRGARSLVACLTSVLSSSRAGCWPSTSTVTLRGDRRATRLRHEDRRQRAATGEAQGRHPPRLRSVKI